MSNEYFEILAPAGGPEALKAAVFAGADAVYLGGPAFGAGPAPRTFPGKSWQRRRASATAGACGSM